MSRDLQLLKHRGGSAARLLRAAAYDAPSAEARRRALACAAAVSTLAATGGAAALGASAVATGQGSALGAGAVSGNAALLKSILVWTCIGAAGGGSAALATSIGFEAARERPQQPQAQQAEKVMPVQQSRQAEAHTEAPSPASSATAAATAPVALTAPWLEPSLQVPIASLPAGSGVAAFESEPLAQRSVFDELRLIEAARSELNRGGPASAARILDSYDASYPTGKFRPEALALRVQALVGNGELAAARLLADQFRRRYPQHPLLPHVLAAIPP
jgi:hypothetical protein